MDFGSSTVTLTNDGIDVCSSVSKFLFVDTSEEGLQLTILEVISVVFLSDGHILHR